MSIRIRGKPLNITIIVAYAPTANASEDELENFYARLQETADAKPTKPQDITYIVGDFNAKVGNQQETDIVGAFGSGETNLAIAGLIFAKKIASGSQILGFSNINGGCTRGHHQMDCTKIRSITFSVVSVGEAQ